MSDRSIFARWRRRRLERAQLRLKDEIHDYKRWGFSYTPSRERLQEKRIEKAYRKVVALGGDPDDC